MLVVTSGLAALVAVLVPVVKARTHVPGATTAAPTEVPVDAPVVREPAEHVPRHRADVPVSVR